MLRLWKKGYVGILSGKSTFLQRIGKRVKVNFHSFIYFFVVQSEKVLNLMLKMGVLFTLS